MEVTDDVQDSPTGPNEASKCRKVVEAYMDSSYGSWKTYEYLKAKGIEAVVKPKSNSRADMGHHARREAIRLFRELVVRHGPRARISRL